MAHRKNFGSGGASISAGSAERRLFFGQTIRWWRRQHESAAEGSMSMHVALWWLLASVQIRKNFSALCFSRHWKLILLFISGQCIEIPCAQHNEMSLFCLLYCFCALFARKSSYCFQRVLAIAILSVRLSVHHTGGSVKNGAN